MNKCLSLACIALLILALVIPARAADGPIRRLAAPPEASESHAAIRVQPNAVPDLQTPSQEEIRAKWNTVTYATSLYVTEPSVSAPYAAGQLSDNFLESGITYLNYVRFVAGLPEVVLDETLTEDAQHGAVLLSAIDQLTHYPSRPSDMDADFYNRGYGATRTSNISARWGYAPLTCIQSSVRGCMDDSGDNNLSALGHRRWLLNPTLGKVGFGYAQSNTGWSYIVTPVFDYSGTGCEYDFIGWPVAGNHPTNLFGTEVPWSITLNPSVYQAPSLDTVKITITRESDGKQWHFDKTTGNPTTNTEAYMTVNNDGYGVRSCIIFHPGSRNLDACTGTFRVDVSGIFRNDGTEATLSYHVNFFDVESVCAEHHYEAVVTEPTCTEEGYTTFTCTLCGHSYVDYYVGIVDHVYEDGCCKWCGEEEVLASGICGENLTWVLSLDGTLTISGEGAMYDYDYAMSPWYSYWERIFRVVVEDGATQIGENAFRELYLVEEVSLTDTIVEIGNFAFMHNEALREVELPENLTVLGQEAFFNCFSLERIELPGSLTFIDACVFHNCTSLREAVIHSDRGGSLTLGNSIFRGCTALEVIRCEPHFALVSVDGILCIQDAAGLILHQYPLGSGTTALIIPQNTYMIGQLALENADYLEEVTIPASVEAIEPYAFSNCDNLESVVFQGDAPEMGEYIFSGTHATVYYPAGNETWTADVMQNYGGTITWVPYGEVAEPTVNWSTISTSLGGNIAMNFYVELSKDLVADPDAYIRFTFADKTIQVPLSEGKESVKNGVTIYQFSCPITSKNMTDEITAQVYNASGAVGPAKTMSVDTYCNWVIQNFTDEKTVNLMKAMLNYGASAQMLFNYRTDDLANAALAAEDKIFGAVDASAYIHSRTGEEEGIKPVSYTLLLDSETTIRCYFELTGDKSIEEFTFTVDGVEVQPQYRDGRWYIEKTNIAAHRLDDMHVFTCGNITITYGGLSYVNQVMTYYESGTTFDMASALYAYSKAAEAYIG